MLRRKKYEEKVWKKRKDYFFLDVKKYRNGGTGSNVGKELEKYERRN